LNAQRVSESTRAAETAEILANRAIRTLRAKPVPRNIIVSPTTNNGRSA
jgi:hypothetical protein